MGVQEPLQADPVRKLFLRIHQKEGIEVFEVKKDQEACILFPAEGKAKVPVAGGQIVRAQGAVQPEGLPPAGKGKAQKGLVLSPAIGDPVPDRIKAEDVLSGVQVGLYNSAGRADLKGLQLGLFNEARSMRGIQVGIVNLADSICGFQVGLINRAETMYGFQVGGVNVIRESEMAFCPIVNIGFDIFPNY
jgi:hypothetical protein